MKTFLLRLLKFLSAGFVLIFALEYIIDINRTNFFQENKLEPSFIQSANGFAWINHIQAKKKILLVGSSSVKYSLNCNQLNALHADSIAFAVIADNSRDPMEAYFILKGLNLSSENVKAIYYGIDPWIFSKRYYIFRLKRMYLDMNFLQGIFYSIDYDNSFFFKRYVALMRYFLPEQKSNAQPKTRIPKGFGTQRITHSFIDSKVEIDKYFNIERYGWSELQFEYIHKIDSLCKSRNIPFYTFVPPRKDEFTQEYIRHCISDHEIFTNKLITENFHPPIFGKFNSLSSHEHLDIFADSRHLSETGQEIYTRLFFDMMYKQHPELSTQYDWFK